MKILNFLFIAVAAFFLLLAPLSISTNVYNKANQAKVSCGWPASFVYVNFSSYDPPHPWAYDCFASPLEVPIHVNWQAFSLYYFATLIVTSIFAYLVHLITLISFRSKRVTTAADFITPVTLVIASILFINVSHAQRDKNNGILTEAEAIELLAKQHPKPSPNAKITTREADNNSWYVEYPPDNMNALAQCFVVRYYNDAAPIVSAKCQ